MNKNLNRKENDLLNTTQLNKIEKHIRFVCNLMWKLKFHAFYKTQFLAVCGKKILFYICVGNCNFRTLNLKRLTLGLSKNSKKKNYLFFTKTLLLVCKKLKRMSDIIESDKFRRYIRCDSRIVLFIACRNT